MEPSPRRRGTWWMAVWVAISWVGLFVHNVADLPGQSLLSPESLGPLVFSALLLGSWFWWPRVGEWLLLGWAALNVLGAILTVLPLPLLPFAPEQSPAHYAFHGLYLVTQLPLLIAAFRAVRRRATAA